MILARCPACGAPHQLSLATEAFSCGCGHRGPLEPEVQARLHAARDALFAMQVGERQLSALSHRLVARGKSSIGRFVASSYLLLLPFTCCLAVSVWGFFQQGADDITGLILGVTPMVVLATAIASSLRVMRRAVDALRLENAALPPDVPGASPRCSYCGGPLAAPTEDAVVRCGYCAADNVADAATVTWAASRRRESFASTAEQLHARAAALVHVGRRLRFAVFGAAALGPVLACTLTCVAYFVLSTFEVGIHSSIRYVLVDTAAGRCIGELQTTSPSPVRVRFGSQADERIRHIEYTFDEPVPSFRASGVVGIRVRDAAFGDANVRSVHGTPAIRENWAVMPGGPTGTFRRRIHEVCLAPGSSLPGPLLVPPAPPTMLPSSRGAGE